MVVPIEIDYIYCTLIAGIRCDHKKSYQLFVSHRLCTTEVYDLTISQKK